jgi:hypothetical protein
VDIGTSLVIASTVGTAGLIIVSIFALWGVPPEKRAEIINALAWFRHGPQGRNDTGQNKGVSGSNEESLDEGEPKHDRR